MDLLLILASILTAGAVSISSSVAGAAEADEPSAE